MSQKKMYFEQPKKKTYLPVLLKEYIRCCVFMVKMISVNMQHLHFTVDVQHLRRCWWWFKQAEQEGVVYLQ